MSRTTAKPATGVGLVLFRYRGERIMIHADENASDQEILDAIRGEGIVITLVDILNQKNPKTGNSRRVGKIGIRASNVLSIAREEIINRDKPGQTDLDGNLQAKADAE